MVKKRNYYFIILILAVIVLGIFLISKQVINTENSKIEKTGNVPACNPDCSFSIGYSFVQGMFLESGVGDVTVKGYDIAWDDYEQNKDYPVDLKIIAKNEIPENDIKGKLNAKKCSFMVFTFENVSGLVRRSCK